MEILRSRCEIDAQRLRGPTAVSRDLQQFIIDSEIVLHKQGMKEYAKFHDMSVVLFREIQRGWRQTTFGDKTFLVKCIEIIGYLVRKKKILFYSI